MKKTITYHAKGIFHGYLWDNGKGTYPTISFSSTSKENLDKQINDAIINGTISPKKDFQAILGAGMEIETKTVIEVEGKEFSRVESEFEFYGENDEETKEFIRNNWW